MHNNTLNLDFYFYYLMIGIILTGGLSAFLYWQGGRFLMEAFQKDENFARRTNSMLLVGFILLNFGYIFLTANPGIDIVNTNHLFEKLVYRIGIFIIILAVEHTCSLIGLYVIRQRRKVKTSLENSEY